ncbi:MAG: response regulator transcription factor [Eubacterium sp.]|nr:response regulator transcription factor [Eubacterium sp.]
MNYVVCDDDSAICHQVKKLILSYYSLKELPLPQISLFSSGEELMGYTEHVDIAYIDVEMEGISGLNAAKKLRERNPRMLIIVVTSFNEYLDEAFEYKAYRFIKKPLNKEYFFKNLQSAIRYHETRIAKVTLQTRSSETLIINMDEIIIAQKELRKVILYTVNGTIYPVLSMDELEKLLVPGFFRVHKTCIVNFHYITRFDHETITLKNGAYTAYIPRRVYTDFKKAFLTYMKSTE